MLVDLTKAEIIQRGVQLGVDYGKTHSCYDPDLKAWLVERVIAVCCVGEVSKPPVFPIQPGTRMTTTLPVPETLDSIQGEGSLLGTPSFFIRTAGCNLRCTWCDTPYASWDGR